MQRDDVERRVLDAFGRAMGQFSMLRPGDRVAVGVSGGKDSLCLLHALVRHQRRAPVSHELIAVTIEQGKFKAPITTLASQIEGLGVRWVVREDPGTLRLVRRLQPPPATQPLPGRRGARLHDGGARSHG